MLTLTRSCIVLPRGATLIEVLIAILIAAFGVLALASLMGKMVVVGVEVYQRSQAIVLLSDMVERINTNIPVTAAQANNYVTNASLPLGTGDSQPASCTGLAIGATRDFCEWSNALKGAAETKSGNNVGSMLGARGCIELLTPPNPNLGICTPATFRVTVVWQGEVETAASSLACGLNLFGTDTFRRAIAEQITIGLPDCT